VGLGHGRRVELLAVSKRKVVDLDKRDAPAGPGAPGPSSILSRIARRVVSLPIVEEAVMASDSARRAAARVGGVDKRCEDCKSWRHERGQQAIAARSGFSKVAMHLSPDAMSRTPATRSGVTWGDYGLCTAVEPAPHANVVVPKTHTCKSWS
jgi:hypothetical protein